jgi:hypothetical protein
MQLNAMRAVELVSQVSKSMRILTLQQSADGGAKAMAAQYFLFGLAW